MYLPFLNLFVWYDALQYMSSNLLRGWCVAYVGDASAIATVDSQLVSLNQFPYYSNTQERYEYTVTVNALLS
jgi:hypothetical protein